MKHILFCLTQYIQNMYSLDGVEEGSEEKLILSGDEIELNIPEEGVVLPSGWAILPLTQLKVNKYLNFSILPRNVLTLWDVRPHICDIINLFFKSN